MIDAVRHDGDLGPDAAPRARWDSGGDAARAALAYMSDAACLLDGGGVIAFNDAFVAYHRFPSREACAQALAENFAHLELRAQANGEALPHSAWPSLLALHGETANSVEFHLRRIDSGESWIGSYSYAPIRDAAQTIVGAIVTARDVTSQHQARRRLELERQRLRLALDSTGAAIWEIDLASGTITANASSWMERYGYSDEQSPRDFAGWLELVHPDDRPRVEQVMTALRSGWESAVTVDYRIRTPVQWRWVQSRAIVALRDAADRPQRLMGIHLDIHDRHQVDEAMRENENRLKTVFEANEIGVWDWNVAQDSFGYSARMAEMLGYIPAEVPDRAAWLKLLHPDDYINSERALREHLAGRSPFYSAEIRLRAKDGHWRWVYTRGQAVDRDAQGHARRVMGIHLDITERKQTENALAASEARLRAVVDNIPLGIVLANAQGLPQFTNLAFRRIMGLSAEQSRALDWMEYVPATDRDALIRQQTALVDGLVDEIHQDFRYQRPDQPPVMLSARIVRVDAPHADFTFIGIGEDVTLERAQEEEHRRLLRQVQQAQKMEAIGQLAGGIAHDFNNLLTAVVGFSELAMQRFVSDRSSKLAEYLGAVIAAGERGRELVAKMLAFSRREPAGQHQAAEPLRVAREVETMLASMLPSSIRFSVVEAGDTPPVRMDAIDLHQLLVNLVVNARDAIDSHGEIVITLGVESAAQGHCSACQAPVEHQHYVPICVRDTGMGMDADTLRRIFEPFYTTKEVGRGTGMGLAVVHGILHQAGGHVQVESAPGAGTEFRLLLRAVEGAAAVHARDTELHGVSAHSRVGFAGLRILVVDDEPSVRAYVGEMLEGMEARVTRAQDGREALDLVLDEPGAYDLVFTDQTMPRMTGSELLIALRAAGNTLPVILCSGYSDAASRRAVAEQGATFLAKPAGPDDILAALTQALER
ncbi:MAG: PAS domain-containing protein [Gammaproteobacteria bacterium]|nr:PAS domain-containing protein [Gammaproteobacteria bacterium]